MSFFFSQVNAKNFLCRYNMTEEDYRMLEVVITAGQPHKAGPQWKVRELFQYFQSNLTLFFSSLPVLSTSRQ